MTTATRPHMAPTRPRIHVAAPPARRRPRRVLGYTAADWTKILVSWLLGAIIGVFLGNALLTLKAVDRTPDAPSQLFPQTVLPTAPEPAAPTTEPAPATTRVPPRTTTRPPPKPTTAPVAPPAVTHTVTATVTAPTSAPAAEPPASPPTDPGDDGTPVLDPPTGDPEPPA